MGLRAVDLHLPNVIADRDRHGNVRLYYRVKGKPKVRLRETPGTAAFLVEIEAAKAAIGQAQPASARAIGPDTLRGLCLAYVASAEFRLLDKATGNQRRLLLEDICRSAHRKKGVQRGTLEFARMEARHVEEIRDEKFDKPGAANNRVKALRQLFKWAIAKHRARQNPAQLVAYLPPASAEGHITWTAADIEKFEAAHPIGSKARLYFALLVYTGVRRSDVVKLGPPHARDGVLHFHETKGSRKRGADPKVRDIPIIPALQEVLDGSRHLFGPFTYLVTERGAPFTVNGFGNKVQDWCADAGLPKGLASHGVRKAAAVHAAENGATVNQLMSLFGWVTEKEAVRYTRMANRKKLAAQAAPLLAFKR